MSAIHIRLNGEVREIPPESTLTAVLDLFELPSQRIAIELNGEVVTRLKWPETPVSDGDRIEVIHFVGGG